MTADKLLADQVKRAERALAAAIKRAQRDLAAAEDKLNEAVEAARAGGLEVFGGHDSGSFRRMSTEIRDRNGRVTVRRVVEL